VQKRFENLRFRLGIVVFFSFLILVTLPTLFAQKANGRGGDTHAADSAKEARKAALDSIKEARTHQLDSVKVARKRIVDSVKVARKIHTDSLNTVHKYRDSKHYKDSVTHARTTKMDVVKKQRKDNLDVLKTARKKTTDSTIAARKFIIDKAKAIQKRRSDSLAVIRKYKSSKRFRDSVSVVQHDRLDSLRDARTAFNDSMTKVRKRMRDAEKAVRQHIMDSTAQVRSKRTDSMNVVRKKRADALAKQKADREKLAKSRANLQEKKMQLALDLKMKQKHEKWSNQQMLKKKWTPVRKGIQNTFTRYNYFYNADKKMDEALLNMQRTRRENYDTLIGLYSFDPNRDSSLLSADMDSIIRKASVGIQIHDPRTKWGDDLYLLLGEANYYKGRYAVAGTSFRYIISMDEEKKKKKAQSSGSSQKKNTEPSIVEDDKKTMLDFLKHRTVHNEAILWLARTFTESHNIENAESVLSLLDADPKLPESLKGRIAMEKAFVALNDNNFKEAATQLAIAAKDNNLTDNQRQRAAYLNGQLLQRNGEYTAATSSFKQVIDLSPKIELDFYARKYMAYNTMYAGGDVDGMISSLKKVLNDGKYIPYYDQVYYLLGQLAVSANKPDDAIVYLNKSIKTPKSTKKQKAISFATLGNVYYSSSRYVEAKRAYDSAAALASYAPADTLMITALRRSRVLGEVTRPMAVIHAEDSLLELASMGDKEQRVAIRRYIRSLQQRRDDSAYNAENGGLLAASAQQGQQGGGTDVASWYFANPTLMQQGYNEFKRKWGNRTLADNWGRQSAMSATAGNNNNAAATDSAANNGQLDENGLPTVESLLAFIPNTDDARAKARNRIQLAYLDLGKAYVKELEDYNQALKTLDTLDSRFPEHKYKPDVLYLRYLVALRQGRLDDAQIYSAQLLKQYPESPLAVLVRPAKEDAAKADAAASAGMANYYDETYSLLIQHQYVDVLSRTHTALKQFKDSTYTNRFRIMQAIALVGQGEYKQADTLLTEYMHVHPSDSLRDWAESVVKYMSKNPKGPAQSEGSSQEHYRQWPYYDYTHNYSIAEDGSLVSGGHGDTVYSSANPYGKPAAASAAGKTFNTLPGLITFTYAPQAQHYVVIKFPEIDLRSTALRNSILEMNTTHFTDSSLSVLIDILSLEQSTLVVKKFANASAAQTYMEVLRDSDIFNKYKAGEISMFIISADNYRILLNDADINPYLSFYTLNYPGGR